MNFVAMRRTDTPLMTDILQGTDRCVMCGLCLPHCPTYGETRHEADSPRGRIALMRALESDRLPAQDALVKHLDGCLGCRACEAVCPAGVPYGELIDATRARLHEDHQRRLNPVRPFTNVLVKQHWSRRLAYWILLGYQRLGAQKIAHDSGLLKLTGLARAESLVPQLDRAPRKPVPTTVDPNRGRVALFTGCIAEIFDRETLAAAERVLRRLGYDVEIPKRQTCCGALHLHDGAMDTALGLMKRNVRAFDLSGIEAIISTATGCGVQLAEYAQHLDDPAVQRLVERHTDICQFLVGRGWSKSLRLKPLRAKVAVHTPCSQTHVLRQPGRARELLARIPGIGLIELPDNALCCGAAGSYMLREPKMADDLLAPKIAALKTLRPHFLATSNIGCALHLKGGLRRAGLKIEVLHPVALLDRQLEIA
jgi:glycolate oxidase iron-sulfur subunit